MLSPLSPSSSLHRLEESPVTASNIIIIIIIIIIMSPLVFFLVFLRPLYQVDDTYKLEVESKSVPAFSYKGNIRKLNANKKGKNVKLSLCLTN
jgi:hypothetical protein